MSECPFCKEEIREDAVACKHCGATLKFGGRFQSIGWLFSVLSLIAVLPFFFVGSEAGLFSVFLVISIPTAIWAFVQAKKHKDGLWYR